MNILLSGMPYSGKSTAGQQLATILKWTWRDTDRMIEHAHGCPCREIYLQAGPLVFRKLEKAQLQSLTGSTRQVISLGGGTLLEVGARAVVRQLGTIVYLKADIATLAQRVDSTSPPAYFKHKKNASQELQRIYERRKFHYEQTADLTIDIATDSAEEIAQRILFHLQERYGK